MIKDEINMKLNLNVNFLVKQKILKKENKYMKMRKKIMKKNVIINV